MRISKLTIAIGCMFLFACKGKDDKEIVVVNPHDFKVENEILEISIPDSIADSRNLGVVASKNNDTLASQIISISNETKRKHASLLFQTNIEANSQKSFHLIKTGITDTIQIAYSRFVPERTGDYAWENDKVAFRTFGPEAQKLAEEGIDGGTLSSGIDCWLKKVEYPIINKWYKKNQHPDSSYHEDHGEGLDNFHVGTSRGCGGIGYFYNGELHTSKNFIKYKTLSNGPLRTQFMLYYEDWSAGEKTVSEKKRITLDANSNLMRIEEYLSGVDTISIGLTLHENDGAVSMDTGMGWFSYWQPHGNSKLGMGIILEPKYYVGHTKLESIEKDKSHLLVHAKVINGKMEYYTGFAWKEQGDYMTKTQWEDYLAKKARLINNPIYIDQNNED